MNTPGDCTMACTFLMVALTLSLNGCGDEGLDAKPPVVGAPLATPPPPAPAPPLVTPPCGTNPPPAECSTIEFEVYSPTGALADAHAGIWIQPDTGWGEPYDYWVRYGILQPDRAGYFVTKPLPPATLTVVAFAPDFGLQPCTAIIKSPSATVTRIEVFPTTVFDTIEALRPSNATEPSLVGTIYEMTPEGRKPVSGAYMGVGYESTDPYWWINEKSIASTLSSLGGHFYFCRLPPGIQIYVAKTGFMDTVVHPAVDSAGVPLDIELRRNGT